MSAVVLRGDARRLPLPDGCVDLVVTSPPYFGLRSYTDGGAHYAGQIGSEGTPAEWLEALWVCTAEWVRVLKPEGSIFVNLGDKYSDRGHGPSRGNGTGRGPQATHLPQTRGPMEKSLLGLPWRYALGCTDRLGLILRAEIVWAKPNGLPESVTDRVRRAHEQVFHLVKQPRYYSAVDEIREPHVRPKTAEQLARDISTRRSSAIHDGARGLARGGTAPDFDAGNYTGSNSLGKLPGSVWEIPSAPLKVPEWLGVDHFACVDADTEILTARGWLRHDQLQPGEQVAGYDLDTNTARWTECTAVNRYDYDADLIAVESRDLSMRLTPNHRAIVQRMHTRSNKRSPLRVVRADELDHRHFIPRSAAWERYGEWRTSERIAAVMGWVAAEGWYDGQRIRLSQSLDANPENVAAIDRLIPDAARSERKRRYQGKPYTEVNWTLGVVASLLRQEMPDKLLPWWLLLAAEDERRGCLNAFIDGDGHRRPDGRIGIYQKHRHNLDVLQAIAVTLGYKTTLREGNGRFVLYLTEGGRSVTLRGTSGVGSKVKREHYRGTVWCPTTGTGTFIARRNGSVFVTGNSFPPALVRPLVLGWSPPGVCTACGHGRRPVVALGAGFPRDDFAAGRNGKVTRERGDGGTINRINGQEYNAWRSANPHRVTGYACACPEPDAPTRPALVLDPFAGTGTTMLVASAYGRHAIGTDLSADYCRLAAWRVNDPGERARARAMPKPPPVPDGMEPLFTM